MDKKREREKLQGISEGLSTLISQNNLSQAILLCLDIAIRLKELKKVS